MQSEPSPGPRPATERRHLGGGVLASTAAQMLVLVSTALTSVLIARILGPEGVGATALAAALLAFSLLLVGLGLKQGVVVLVGSGRWPLHAVLGDLALPLLALGLLGAGFVLGIYELTRNSALSGVPAGVVPAIAASIGFGLAWQWSWSLALARERYEAYAVVFAATPVATLLLVPGLAFAFDIEGAVAGVAAGQAVAGLLGVGWVLRSDVEWSGVREAAAERRERLRAALRFGLQSWGSELLRVANLRLDLFILAAFVSTAEVGHYSVAVAVTGIGLILPLSLATAIMPRTAILAGASRRGEIESGDADISDARACRHAVVMLPLSALIVMILILAGIPLLYGAEFDDSIALGLILLPGVLLLGLYQVMISIVQGRGHPEYALYAALLTVPPTIAAYFLVIPELKATGAALVSLGAYALSALVGYAYFHRVTGIGARRALVPSTAELRAYPEVLTLTLAYMRRAPAALSRGR